MEDTRVQRSPLCASEPKSNRKVFNRIVDRAICGLGHCLQRLVESDIVKWNLKFNRHAPEVKILPRRRSRHSGVRIYCPCEVERTHRRIDDDVNTTVLRIGLDAFIP